MEQNKTGRYFKYAIGEIILVVIGILMALQINNWNEARKESLVERNTLKSLKQDLGAAMIQLDEKIRQNNNFKFLDSVLLDAIHFKKEISNDSLETLMLGHIFSPGFDPELGTLNEILNTGKMGLIKNDSLRNYVSNWNKYMDELSEVDAKLEHLNLQVKSPLYLKYLPMKNFISSQNQYFSTAYNPYPKSNYKWDSEALLTSIEFENMLANYILYGYIQNTRFFDIKNNMNAMISIITNELSHD